MHAFACITAVVVNVPLERSACNSTHYLTDTSRPGADIQVQRYKVKNIQVVLLGDEFFSLVAIGWQSIVDSRAVPIGTAIRECFKI